MFDIFRTHHGASSWRSLKGGRRKSTGAKPPASRRGRKLSGMAPLAVAVLALVNTHSVRGSRSSSDTELTKFMVRYNAYSGGSDFGPAPYELLDAFLDPRFFKTRGANIAERRAFYNNVLQIFEDALRDCRDENGVQRIPKFWFQYMYHSFGSARFYEIFPETDYHRLRQWVRGGKFFKCLETHEKKKYHDGLQEIAEIMKEPPKPTQTGKSGGKRRRSPSGSRNSRRRKRPRNGSPRGTTKPRRKRRRGTTPEPQNRNHAKRRRVSTPKMSKKGSESETKSMMLSRGKAAPSKVPQLPSSWDGTNGCPPAPPNSEESEEVLKADR